MMCSTCGFIAQNFICLSLWLTGADYTTSEVIYGAFTSFDHALRGLTVSYLAPHVVFMREVVISESHHVEIRRVDVKGSSFLYHNSVF